MTTPHPDRSLALRGVDGPAWSPDGKWFAYIFDGRLWRVPVTPEGAIAGAPIRMTDELADALNWASDSQSILYLGVDRLKRIDLTGKVADAHPHLAYTPEISSERIVIHAGRLIDVVSGTSQRDMDIVIDGNLITSIEPHRAREDGARVIDASGQSIIPGLIEPHTHMTSNFGERLGRIWLAMGVTAVREPGADPYDALERREAWVSGRRLGPRGFMTGGLTDGSRVFYGFANSVTTPEHLDLELERARWLDYDLIKTYVRMPDHVQKTIVARAHQIGIPVSSHEIFPAVGYGVDAVEHLRGTSRRGYSPKQTEMGFSYADVTDLLAKSGMTITPTMGLSGGFNLKVLRDPAILAHPVYTALFRDAERAALKAGVDRVRQTEPSLARSVDAMGLAITDIIKKGGRITAGTDSPFIPYGLSFLVELMLYEDAGLSPADVLRSATIWPAAVLGVDKHLGTIEPGKLADLVIVDGDPLARISDLAKVHAVVSNGRYLPRADLMME
ncbi:MAG: amidohydrolase family protein [Alphaproteobacteria bacterium]|nr:amidohydrolase family protein [Alphaproteobacteria bacterium]